MVQSQTILGVLSNHHLTITYFDNIKMWGRTGLLLGRSRSASLPGNALPMTLEEKKIGFNKKFNLS
jgi:hypothetical protein